MILDIDECRQGINLCSQNCHNSIGSYVCTCGSGFLINVDGKTCVGEYMHVHTLKLRQLLVLFVYIVSYLNFQIIMQFLIIALC